MNIDKTCTTKEIATLFGLTERWVRDLTKKEVLHRARGSDDKEITGRYDLAKTIKDYINYQKNFDVKNTTLEEEQILKVRTEREIAELRLAKMRATLHEAADVEDVMTVMLSNFRSRLLSIPDKWAQRVVLMKDINSIREALKEAVTEALMELKEYDPADFATDYVDLAGEDVE